MSEMTPRNRLKAVFAGEVPDKVPHFELVFQIPEEAFGLSWPTGEEMTAASPKERERVLERYFHISELILDRYEWAAIDLPTSLYGFFDGEVIPRAVRRFGNRAMLYGSNGSGTYWMPSGVDMVEFAVMLFERPDEAHAKARVKCDASIEYAKQQVGEGLDFICINSDYGYNQGPFISPKMFREFVTPYLTEIVGAIHDLGVPAILHSDGDLREILDQLVSTGLDGYQSVDPQGHMDIAEVKRQYGDRLVLMGNVQASLLQDEDDSRIRESVQYCLTHGKPGGRYIFSSSNCIFNGVPLKNYHVMLEEYERLAAY
jgi:uroporphyrinogen decarboxylase